MRLHYGTLGVASFLILAGVAYVNQVPRPAAAKMAQAATKFLDTLPAEQKQKALFAFDDKERTRWHFFPLQDREGKPTRKGVRLEEMSQESKAAALELLRSGTSADGYKAAIAIMSLESILRELEKGRSVRNPEWYFFTIFGTPSKSGKWGWRVEGHHLSLNFTIEDGKVVSSTPAFFGASPAIIKHGPRQGQKTLTDVDDLACELFKSLDKEQRKAVLKDKHFPETPAQQIAPATGDPMGLPAGRMTEPQREILRKLLKAYIQRMPEDVAQAKWEQVEAAGLDKVYFAFAGNTEEGRPRSYRLQGPTFVAEFLNVQADSAQNPANHIHSSWRSIKGDFGLTVK